MDKIIKNIKRQIIEQGYNDIQFDKKDALLIIKSYNHLKTMFEEFLEQHVEAAPITTKARQEVRKYWRNKAYKKIKTNDK